MKAVLYRHFSADGELLYVGCSTRFLDRMYQHGITTEWFSDVANITLQHFESPHAALLAEEEAIKTELPKYNFAHKPGAIRKPRRKWPTNPHPQLDSLKRFSGSDRRTAFMSKISVARMWSIRETGEPLSGYEIKLISKGMRITQKKLAALGISVG